MSSRCEAEPDTYHAPASSSEGELREKGSRFLARLLPVTDEATVQRQLRDLERVERDATHHCWAFRLGWPAIERSADAGEPAGTAGVPILQVLRGAGLSDVLLVVTRWYGGTKLGKGGLARAYASSARLAVAAGDLVVRVPEVAYRLVTDFERVGRLQHLLARAGVRIETQQYGEEAAAETVEIEVAVEAPSAARFEAAISDLGPKVTLERIPGANPS